LTKLQSLKVGSFLRQCRNQMCCHKGNAIPAGTRSANFFHKAGWLCLYYCRVAQEPGMFRKFRKKCTLKIITM